MQVKNNSARLWTVDGIPLIPGKTTTIPDSHAKSIEGIKELEIVEAAEDVDFKEVPTTKAEIAAALKEKGIEFNSADSKAELQALLDAAPK